MKKQFIMAGLITMIYTAGFAQTDYRQYEVIYVKPKLGQSELLKKGLADHNKKFHGQDPYRVSVSSVVTGPNSGDYVWVMGPSTWTQLDNAPGEGDHMTDWDHNINPYCESIGETMFWRGVNEVNYTPDSSESFQKSRMRAEYVYPGQMERFIAQMKKVAEVFKQKKYNASFTMATRVGLSQGPNAVTFVNFEKYAFWDSDTNFEKDYEEVHGLGSFADFIEELDLCFDRSKTYDELSETVSELGTR
jgi:hypothetical protein